MTPKEKAIELVDKYFDLNWDWDGVTKYDWAKEGAIIAVKEEIKSLMWLNLLCTSDNYMKEHISDKVAELQEIEQEIEKL